MIFSRDHCVIFSAQDDPSRILDGVIIKLGRYTVFNITKDIISEVSEVMGDVKKVGIRIDWLDRLVGDTLDKGSILSLCRKFNILREQVKEVEKSFNFLQNQFKQV